MYHIFLIHSPVYAFLGCFHVLVIVNSAAVNIGVHVSFWIIVCLHIFPGVGLLDHMVVLSLVFCGTSKLSSIVVVPSTNLPSHQQWRKVPQKTKYRTTIWSSNPTPGYNPDKTFTEKDTCTPMFTVALFTRAKTWKQPKCPSTDNWIRKMWYIYTMEYYSAIKRTK